ncbi:GvpL/GvpF family gas vesicle protein [Streptomyces sp. 130]|uniref:GvpL/GvpF family gas vesicle protein n=1 Tax=Streptomyces sp. 130 TaxID=2591006 RepID=UPI00117E7557|nr:GvpL/GvpF family gas vesicle protein [Streptomyces sp. 130]TRV81102.1 GvpL/GvpF family gas vesicle protein [Streptomyces sp. 130]
MTADGVYVYAITRAETPLPDGLGGVGGPPARLRTVRRGRLAAVVSDAPPDLRARRRDLLAHQDLLLRLMDEGPVLPMRFGMVAPGQDAVERQLAAGEDGHVAALERLAGCHEINVKALAAEDALAEVVAEDATVRKLREAARRRPGYETSLRLGEAVAASLARRAAEAGRRVLRELTPRARAVAAGPEVQGCALNVSFLVEREAGDAFLARARRFAADHRGHVELRLAGPLPCYSFVSAETRPVPAGGG